MQLTDRLAALIVDEGKWLTASMTLAAIGVVLMWLRARNRVPVRRLITASMNLSSGVVIGSMAFGHLLAVGTKLAMGTLREGSLTIFLAIGIGLLVPAWMVTRHTRALLAGAGDDERRSTVRLNAWLAATLLVIGLHNVPLALPSLLTIAYRLHSGGLVGWTIVGAAVALNVGLFAASWIFLLSGQSFEQFTGIE